MYMHMQAIPLCVCVRGGGGGVLFQSGEALKLNHVPDMHSQKYFQGRRSD